MGQPIDKDQAIVFYEKAAKFGNENARSRAKELLNSTLDYTTDIDTLESGLKRLNALQKPEDEDFSDIATRLASIKAWDSLLKAQKETAKPLPNLPIVLNACELDLNQAFGNKFNIGWNTAWKLEAYTQLDEPELLGVEGLITKKGCAFNINLPAKARELLDHGVVLGLRFPGLSLPLQWQKEGKTIMLKLMPIGTPLPDF
ncbi:MAG: hypothetical protein PHU29_04805, partial [Sulfuricurvum sp.]|nr:hypothetical protein [Sulfuricurvum sp.]